MDAASAGEDAALLLCLYRITAAADRFAAGHPPGAALAANERREVLAMLADLAVASSALAQRSRELEQRIAAANSGLRATASYRRAGILAGPSVRLPNRGFKP